MKKLLLIILLCAGSYFIVQNASAQSVRLHGYTTYAFDDNNVSGEYFDGKIKGGFQYGGGLEVMPGEAVGLEFTYLRLESNAPMSYYYGGISAYNLDLTQNWLFLSFNKYVPVNEKVEPFAGLQLGMDIIDAYNNDTKNSNSATKFAWGIKAGVNIWASEKVGLKLNIGLMSAVQAIGGGLYFGTGGAGAGVTGFSTYYQFNLGGGLVFKIR